MSLPWCRSVQAFLQTPVLLLAHLKQVPQLLQRDHTAGWVSFSQSGRLQLGDNIYGHYKSIFNHCDAKK